MTGIQDVVFRIPEEWDPVWFQNIIQDLFQFADVRNAAGVGVNITGSSDEIATLTSTTLGEAYVVTEASGELTDERVLAGEATVIDITDGGPGNNVTVSVVTNGLDFEKIQQIATSRFTGRITAGTGNIEELTGTQATTLLDAFVGDSGAGGLKGLVPAPITGDAGKYLDGDGTFVITNTAFNSDFGLIAGTVLEGDTTPFDIGAQPVDDTLTTIAATDPSTDQINYFTGLNVASVTSLTAFGRSLIDDSDAGTARTTLGLVIGTDVQAWDADLDVYAANPLTSAELGELQNINSVTISNAQWVFLGDFNQALSTTSNVSFGTGTFSGILKTTDTTDATSATTGASQNAGGGSVEQSFYVGEDLVTIGRTGTNTVSNLVVSSGAITVNRGYHRVDTEGAAATDDLDTIDGGILGMKLVLTSVSAGRDTTLKATGGNLRLTGAVDFTLANTASNIHLFFTGSLWLELSRKS